MALGSVQLLTPTPGTTVTIGPLDPSVHKIQARWTAGQAETLNINGTPEDGQELTLIVTNDGVLGRVLTLGTGFLGLGVITGIVSKKSLVSFVSDGGVFHERSRSIGL